MDNSRFIIFLDVDGVLCSWLDMKIFEQDGEHGFVEEAIKALNAIITCYDADLCMISSWNTKFKDEESYKAFLVSRGIFVNNLYIGDHNNRAEWIISQIKEHDLHYYLIIDDEAFGYYEKMKELQYKRILKTNRYRCLDMHDFAQVTRNFKLMT